MKRFVIAGAIEGTPAVFLVNTCGVFWRTPAVFGETGLLDLTVS